MNLTTYTEAGFLKPISYPEAGTWNRPQIQRLGFETDYILRGWDMNLTTYTETEVWNWPHTQRLGFETNHIARDWDMKLTTYPNAGTWNWTNIYVMPRLMCGAIQPRLRMSAWRGV
jgi:hypothetical protein